MTTSQFLLTLVVVCAAIAGYHFLIAPSQEPSAVPLAGGTGGGPAPSPELGGSGTERALADLARRVEALERAGGGGNDGGGTKHELPADLDTFRTMLSAARQADAEERQRQHFRNTVKRFAKGAAAAEIDAAVDILARYYAGVRATYADAGTDVDQTTREALMRRVDDLQAQAEKELQAILGDEAAAALRKTMPGGTRGGIGALSDPRKPPR